MENASKLGKTSGVDLASKCDESKTHLILFATLWNSTTIITLIKGIYVVDLKESFEGTGSAAVSWISSILVGVTLGSGKEYFHSRFKALW